ATSNTNLAYKETIFYIYLGLTIVLIILAILYSVPAIYKRGQKMQYFVLILVSQMIFGLFFLISPLFLLGMKRFFWLEESSLIMISILLVSGGILLFTFTWIRFMILLK